MFDVCVLGSGPGGYVSAIRCAQNGLSTVCVEKSDIGGICLNWGCIPTKALLHCAESLNVVKESKTFGVELKVENVDINKIVEYSRNVVKKLSSGVEMLFKKNKVQLVKGYGVFKDKNTLEVKTNDGKIEVIKAKYFVIATGASPRIKGYENEIDNDLICTYKGAMLPKTIPEKLVIIGGGVIGVEFASFYNSIGSKVVLLQSNKDILTTEDDEIKKKAKNLFIKNGIDIKTEAKILSHKIIEKNNKKQVEIEYEINGEKQKIVADKLILSIGVIPNIEGFGLEKTGVLVDKNCIKTDEMCKTNISNIYAIGDCTYGPWLAHKASREGIIVADDIANKEGKLKHSKMVKLNKNNIPSCVYSFPQIASIGLTEEKCKEQGLEYRIGTFSGVGNGKSIATNELDNFIKVIFDKKTNELLGCHMIGANMTEMIHAISVGKSAELLPDDFDTTIFAHPTVSEIIPEAILDAFGIAIHK